MLLSAHCRAVPTFVYILNRCDWLPSGYKQVTETQYVVSWWCEEIDFLAALRILHSSWRCMASRCVILNRTPSCGTFWKIPFGHAVRYRKCNNHMRLISVKATCLVCFLMILNISSIPSPSNIWKKNQNGQDSLSALSSSWCIACELPRKFKGLQGRASRSVLRLSQAFLRVDPTSFGFL